jgi:hypothetical protein
MTEEEMMADLAAADARGDTQLAQHIAGRIKTARTPVHKVTPQESGTISAEPTTWESFKKGNVKPLLTKTFDAINPEKGAPAARVFASGRTFGTLDSAGAALSALAPPESRAEGRQSWGQRYRANKNDLDAQEQEAENRTPGAPAVKLGGALTSGLAKAMSPTQWAAWAGGFKALPAAAKALLGGAEAVTTSAGLNAANNLDKPEDAALEGAGSWWNLLGSAAPFVEPGIKAVRTALPQTLRRLSATEAWRSLEPSEAVARVAREKFGSATNAGNVLRDAELPTGQKLIEAFDRPQDTLTKLDKFGASAGEDAANLAHLASEAGGQPMVTKLRSDIKQIMHDEFKSPGAKTMFKPEADETTKFVHKIYDDFLSNPNMTLEGWESLKSNLQKYVKDSAAKYGRSEKAVSSNPSLNALYKISGAIKEADEGGLGRTLGQEALRDFSTAKREYGASQTLEPMVASAVDKAAAAKPPDASGSAGWLGRHLTGTGLGAAAGGGYGHSPEAAAGGAAAGFLLSSVAKKIQEAHATKAAGYRGTADALSNSKLLPWVEKRLGQPHVQDAFTQFMRDAVPLPPGGNKQ